MGSKKINQPNTKLIELNKNLILKDETEKKKKKIKKLNELKKLILKNEIKKKDKKGQKTFYYKMKKNKIYH